MRGDVLELLAGVLACELFVEAQVSGFLSREVMEHVCGVGFIKRSRDLHRSEELSHALLKFVVF